MKNFILLLFLTSIYSCSDPSDMTVELDRINVESLQQFVPIAYLEANTKVVYMNEQGDELVFDISSSTTVETRRIDNLEYEREVKSFTLRNKENPDYSLNILLSAHYHDPQTAVKSIDCSLFTDVNGGWIPMIRLDGAGNSRIGQKENITLGERTFTDVFSSIKPAEDTFKFAQIFYNYELGFVGFYDSHNELWYLDRYEEQGRIILKKIPSYHQPSSKLHRYGK